MQSAVRATAASENWIRSSRCGPKNCVELSRDLTDVRIRDSKGDTGVCLVFSHVSWSSFRARCERF
jgi:hypothetical protein